jgi:hypothetical protein
MAKSAWGHYGSPYHWPCYDVQGIAAMLTNRVTGQQLTEVRFYTGVPTPQQSVFWERFWRKTIYALRQRGVYVYQGRISSGNQT